MLKRVLARSIGVVASLALVGVGVVDAAPAHAVYTPSNNKVSFNNPKKKSKKYALIAELDRAINATPRGRTITMAMYLFDRPSTAKALVKAHKRGVNVQILLDNGEKRKEARMLYKELGTNRARKSFVKTCANSCMSSIPASVMHAKLYLFSQSGKAKWVSMVSSANPAYTNSASSWNNNHTRTNDPKIYNALLAYFKAMVTGKNRPNYYRTVTSGNWKLYFFPKALVRGRNTSPMLDVLNNVKCKGVRKGYGSKGRTVIRVGQWGWTSARNDVARRLWTLHKNGCKVDAFINTGRMSKSTLKILLRPTSRGKMKVYDVWRDKNRNDKAERYIHHKMIEINGRWFGSKGTKVVYTGSQNFTSLATYANNDILLRIVSGAVYNAYSKNLTYIRKHSSKRLYSVPSVMNPAKKSSKNDRRAAPSTEVNGVGSDNLEDESWQYSPDGG